MKSPESRQFPSELPHLSARNVLAATIAAVALAGIAPEASAEKREKQRTSLVRQGLSDMDQLRKGDRVKVLDKKVARLVLKKGTNVFTYEPSARSSRTASEETKIVESKLARNVAVVHGLFSQEEERKVACFELGSEPMCVSLTGNQGKILQDKNKPLDLHDISLRSATINLRVDGHLYARMPEDPWAGQVEDQNFNMVKASPVGAGDG